MYRAEQQRAEQIRFSFENDFSRRQLREITSRASIQSLLCGDEEWKQLWADLAKAAERLDERFTQTWTGDAAVDNPTNFDFREGKTIPIE